MVGKCSNNYFESYALYNKHKRDFWQVFMSDVNSRANERMNSCRPKDRSVSWED